MTKLTGYKVIRGYEDWVTSEVLRLSADGWLLYGLPHFESYREPVLQPGQGYGGGGGHVGYYQPQITQVMTKYE